MASEMFTVPVTPDATMPDAAVFLVPESHCSTAIASVVLTPFHRCTTGGDHSVMEEGSSWR